MLPIRELPNDWYDFDQIKQILIGERSGNKFNVGMKLKVKIVEVAPLSGSITVKWVSNRIGKQNKEKKSKLKIKFRTLTLYKKKLHYG